MKHACLLLSFLLCVSTIIVPISAQSITGSKGLADTELVLLRNEHYLYLQAQQDVASFSVEFAFPPLYQYQVPVYLELFNDSTEKLVSYHIENDTDSLNKKIVFIIEELESDEQILLHFTCWVLVENHDYSDLPETVTFPTLEDIPVEIRQWLSESEMVQTNNLLLKMKAHQLRGCSSNMITYAKKVASFIKQHRYLLFVLQLNTGLFLSQDALTTLFISGENVGRSHLACALLRINNVPSRVLLAHNDQGFWTQMHYMVEYYVPDYGWVLLDSTKGETPYATKRQIINRVCYPSDEDDTKHDYILPLMSGEERWLWIDAEDVQPYYLDCDQGSKSQMFTEGSIVTSCQIAQKARNITKETYQYYQQYLGMPLQGENQTFFDNAITLQQLALEAFQEHNINEYQLYLEFAIYCYSQITT